jgi:glutamate 5-kinase
VPPAPVVVKIGTSSLTTAAGSLEQAVVSAVSAQAAEVRESGRGMVIVTSAAISAGLQRLGLERRPRVPTLQAASTVGQIELVQQWRDALALHGLVAGQVLLTKAVFRERTPYLLARSTFQQLLQLGAVPIVNENDAVADDELIFGDNDRLAALVAHLVAADVLVLLTDTPGLLTGDPRLDQHASLIEEIVEIDRELEAVAGLPGERGRGGMASKIAAAKIAAWTGVRTVIAAADRPQVVVDAVAGRPGVGTVVQPRDKRLSARRLWIAFATAAAGRVVVDEGARRALVHAHRSLLPAGVVAVEGIFPSDSAVEVVDDRGDVFAKGLVRMTSAQLSACAGQRTDSLPHGVPAEAIHRDDLVVLPG